MKKDVKQVLVWRNDLKVRKGKIGSQLAHASMSVFFQKLQPVYGFRMDDSCPPYIDYWNLGNHDYFEDFITGAFKKIVVYVNSEEELLAIHKQAEDAGIHCSLIQDAGLTEFGGIPTYTAVGIGPWDSVELNKITGHLPLF